VNSAVAVTGPDWRGGVGANIKREVNNANSSAPIRLGQQPVYFSIVRYSGIVRLLLGSSTSSVGIKAYYVFVPEESEQATDGRASSAIRR
jgi:hypothetical protein